MDSQLQKLETLVNRLEAVQISLEKSAQGGKPVSGNTNKFSGLENFKKLLEVFEDKAKDIPEEEFKALTNGVQNAVQVMYQVLDFSLDAKKPSPSDFQAIIQVFKSKVEPLYPFRNSGNCIEFAKATITSMDAFLWFATDAPEILINGAIEAADFDALKGRYKKNKLHNDWYAALISSLKELLGFTKENYPSGLVWKFDGKQTIDSLLANLSSNEPIKKKDEAEKPKPVQEKASKEKEVVKKVKAARKEKVGTNWNIENYENENLVVSKDEAKMNNMIYVENLSGCELSIEGKVKSIFINKCKNLKIQMNSVLTNVEIMESHKVKLNVLVSCPTAVVSKSNEVTVYLHENKVCDLITGNSNEVNITSKNESGEFETESAITTQIITQWDENLRKFVSKPYEMFI